MYCYNVSVLNSIFQSNFCHSCFCAFYTTIGQSYIPTTFSLENVFIYLFHKFFLCSSSSASLYTYVVTIQYSKGGRLQNLIIEITVIFSAQLQLNSYTVAGGGGGMPFFTSDKEAFLYIRLRMTPQY